MLLHSHSDPMCFHFLLWHHDWSLRDTLKYSKHGLELYVECQILSLTMKTVKLFRYISWLDIWLFRVQFNVRKQKFQRRVCDTLSHSHNSYRHILGIPLGKNKEQKTLPWSVACDSGTDFSSFTMFPDGRNPLFSVLCSLLSDICGPLPLPLGFPTPQSSASLCPSPSL